MDMATNENVNIYTHLTAKSVVNSHCSPNKFDSEINF